MGDVIVRVARRVIGKASDVPSAVHMHRIGERFEVEFVRGAGRRTTTLELAP